ncbi:lebercilin-like protein isoform X1 [Sebastes umbrosus]|uniref:lebercilin-like protein isoform X1 n=1 Tax=Sebastes umbrosus TaxID=72105 RepID=UPI00189EEA9C|nr:lebercilin-like protein isoform X1 [Sebastes umbrosus]
MCERQQRLMQQAFALKEGDGDAWSSTDTSPWSTPSSLHRGFNSPYYSSDFEDQADSLTVVKTSDKSRGSNTSGRKKGPHKQKTNHTANLQVPKLPAIKPLQVSKPGIQSANVNCVRVLKSQVWDLQQQLSKARTENKLLKTVQHRHTVALQHFQDSEGSLSQIITKHSNETRALRRLLRETRACRDNLASQLQTTENKLLSTKASLRRLQLLSQNKSLLEREELTVRLTRASPELEDKDKKILDLEKHLELCQASFNRQIVTEQRKIKEARKISCSLLEQICQLNEEIKDRDRELEKHNIYYHRFLKGSSKKGSENKMVQTDAFVLLPTEAANLLEFGYTETEERLEKQESSVNWAVTMDVAPAHLFRTVSPTIIPPSCSPPVHTSILLSSSSSSAESLVSLTCSVESLVIENPETEVSANVPLEENHQEDTETCADTSEQSSCSEESPEYQTEGDCEEVKEAPQVLEEERKTEEQDSETSYISEKSLNPTEPERKGSKLPKIRRNYAVKQTIENLHSGRPAFKQIIENLHSGRPVYTEEPDQGGDHQQFF